jgi:hypothetical protein
LPKELNEPERKSESAGKVPYRFIICKVKGCVRMHDAYYPMCSQHRKEEKVT